MGVYQRVLPQISGKTCITDGGLETYLIFQKKIDLPEFAAYDLLRSEEGYGILFDYYKTYAVLARKFKLGLILETPTWRANTDWGQKIGDTTDKLHELNVASVKLISHIREEFENEDTPIIISGCLGPRGDGYSPEYMMTAAQAQQYHSTQINSFSSVNVDMVSALTINYIDEAIGITQAAKHHGLPVSISFTVETDGKLPTGESLEEAIHTVDQATNKGPVYYMINCAHPTHFDHLINIGNTWLERLQGIRGNASCMSHEELDKSETLDDGDPEVFGIEINKLREISNKITVLGGCCGTDHRHIEQICRNIMTGE